MNIEELREYCLSLGEVAEKTPFGSFSKRFETVLVFYVSGHMFCLADMADFNSVDVIVSPEEGEALKAEKCSVTTPINRAMKNWVEIELGGDVTDNEIFALISRGYEIVRTKYAGKKKK